MPTATKSPKNTLNCDEICAIIASCEKSGVSVLKFGDLYIKMRPSAPLAGSHEAPAKDLTPPGPPVTEITETQHTEQNKEAIEEDELRLRQQELDQLLIENPALAEQLLMDGELEDDDQPNDDESDD